MIQTSFPTEGIRNFPDYHRFVAGNQKDWCQEGFDPKDHSSSKKYHMTLQQLGSMKDALLF